MPKQEKEKDKKKFRMLVRIEESLDATEVIEEVDLGEFATEEQACDALEDLLEAAGFEEIDDDEKED